MTGLTEQGAEANLRALVHRQLLKGNRLLHLLQTAGASSGNPEEKASSWQLLNVFSNKPYYIRQLHSLLTYLDPTLSHECWELLPKLPFMYVFTFKT